jgi:hypothetical protein
VYRIFETRLTDTALANAVMKNSMAISNSNLGELVLEDAKNGDKGRANAILALPLYRISQAYSALPPEERNQPFLFEENRLDETVAAVLEGVSVPKYQRITIR